MFFTRYALFSAFTLVGLGARINVRQDDSSSVGESISVGLAANRSAPAAEVFGTTEMDVNFLTLPTTLCIVPMYASEAGIGNQTSLLITQQALEICPRAQNIVVCDTSNSTTTNSTSKA